MSISSIIILLYRLINSLYLKPQFFSILLFLFSPILMGGSEQAGPWSLGTGRAQIKTLFPQKCKVHITLGAK